MYMSILLIQDDISCCSNSCPYDRLKLLDWMEWRKGSPEDQVLKLGQFCNH